MTAGSTTTRFAHDLALPLSQILQSQGSVTTTYLYGTERLASVTGTTRAWYTTNGLGSVRQLLSDAGTLTTAQRYDAWGTPLDGTTPTTFGFTGEYQEASLGLVYLRARWYNTNMGRFLSHDPFDGVIEQVASLHAYQYGYNNPVFYSDPTGQKACVVGNPQCNPFGGDITWNPGSGTALGTILIAAFSAILNAFTPIACPANTTLTPPGVATPVPVPTANPPGSQSAAPPTSTPGINTDAGKELTAEEAIKEAERILRENRTQPTPTRQPVPTPPPTRGCRRGEYCTTFDGNDYPDRGGVWPGPTNFEKDLVRRAITLYQSGTGRKATIAVSRGRNGEEIIGISANQFSQYRTELQNINNLNPKFKLGTIYG